MPMRITKVENQAGVTRRLKVEGTLTLTEAELLEGLCNELCEQSESCISIDVANITFLDSESASVLCRLKRRGVSLEGLDLFVRKVVELAEQPGNA